MMLIPIYWTARASIPNLQALLEQVRQHGGSIVEYQRVFSVILFMQISPKFEWVPPGGSRAAAGLKHTVFSLLLGWWSLSGLFATPAAIINNLMGGIDVTRVFTQPPPLPGQSFDSSAMEELAKARKRVMYVYLGFLFLVLGLCVNFFVLPYL
jgi:hypothetical protein